MDKPAEQSEPDYEQDPASNAVDGDKNPVCCASCSATKNGGQQHPWWRVDLEGAYVVHAVELVNRNDEGDIIGRYTLRQIICCMIIYKKGST